MNSFGTLLLSSLLIFNVSMFCSVKDKEVEKEKKKKKVSKGVPKAPLLWSAGLTLGVATATGVVFWGTKTKTDPNKLLSDGELLRKKLSAEEKKLFNYLEELAQYPDDPEKRKKIVKKKEKEIEDLIYIKKINLRRYKEPFKGKYSLDYLFSLGKIKWLTDYLKTPLGRQCINIQERETGFTLLHTSTYRNQEPVIDLLLSLDFVDPNKQANLKNKQATPLHMAVKHSKIETINCYLRHVKRLNLQLKTSEGDDIWGLAKKRNDPAIIQLVKSFKTSKS